MIMTLDNNKTGFHNDLKGDKSLNCLYLFKTKKEEAFIFI